MNTFTSKLKYSLGSKKKRHLVAQNSLETLTKPTDSADHIPFAQFNELLDGLLKPIRKKQFTTEEIQTFWKESIRYLPFCYATLQQIPEMKESGSKTVSDVLNIISKLSTLEPPEEIELFPTQQYAWVKQPTTDFKEVLKDAVNSGANNWFDQLKQENETADGTQEEQLQGLVEVIRSVNLDLQKAIKYYDGVFKSIMDFNYSTAVYFAYDAKLVVLNEMAVKHACKNLKAVVSPIDDLNEGTKLFELYLEIKQFASMGTSSFPKGTTIQISGFYQWFLLGVNHWLDVSMFKAKTRISKAIELDPLTPVEKTVLHSSSVVDTLDIFDTIKVFWQQLDWPKDEGAAIFLGQVVVNIGNCCDFYAEKIIEKTNDLNETSIENDFQVTRLHCLSINNMDYIRLKLPSFFEKLGVDGDSTKVAIEKENDRVSKFIGSVAEKMSPTMRKFLKKGAKQMKQNPNSMDPLMTYLEESLTTLNSELSEQSFEKVLDEIWKQILKILEDLIEHNLEKQRPPSFYGNLLGTFDAMVVNFKCADTTGGSDLENIERIEKMLRQHACDTSEIYHKYYKERLLEQNAMTETPFGQLTIRCFFKENNLELEIMNARNLQPMTSDKSCDPLVKVHILPEKKFANITKPKTKAQTKTLFPIFDQHFVVQLTPKQRAIDDAIVMLSIKDKNNFGLTSQYLAECFISFADIVDGGPDKQIHLPLNKPKKLDDECLPELKHRRGSKPAIGFLKKLKQKPKSN